jgi:hypothetical protein
MKSELMMEVFLVSLLAGLVATTAMTFSGITILETMEVSWSF